ncbi:uncharacterized protein BN507_00440 [Bacteroides clarus CAG:160]|uniref:DUF4982 domain-containing protein n=1 Tax=Bacteroides clarus TaxID=626929 RepID=UPI00033CAF9C|nr:DUF4982 domain-containing protein [Bacteroides clarus]CDB83281.1 uncharacterized protein BN507_00440 [Bacteroides clarus CAG:160]
MAKKILALLFAVTLTTYLMAGDRYNFNAGWKVMMGQESKASGTKYDDSAWPVVTLPYSYNQTEAFARDIKLHTDTVAWFRKTFTLPRDMKGKKFFIEFEGVRQAARVFLNGKELGWSENGTMAFGFDLTPYIKTDGPNVLAVRIDNDWSYHEHVKRFDTVKGREMRSSYQWNNKNFNANYGGITKNVWLHVMGDIYQTLPLYSNLQTTGTYVYAFNHDVAGHRAMIHAESEVKNESASEKTIRYQVRIVDKDGHEVALFASKPTRVAAGQSATLQAERQVDGLHFWSWGYGYLYDVETSLIIDGVAIDKVTTRTGFRKTEYKNGMIYLNDRVLQLKGFAQRSSNEWPAIGTCMPVWMSDYSNGLILGCNGNLVRWMHITPSKQDISSFDRLGLIMAMPAGDAEHDVEGIRWEHRKEVMRDAIIYNRNNPSILFYESGNNEVSDFHMAEMLALRMKYDPAGGRVIGSRNMNASQVAEYGGEMLYINKSLTKPMWMMEYCRDEGIRRYWDEWSYPYHPEGFGPPLKGQPAPSYNHNQDRLAVENVVRWNEYWLARPGTGNRVNSGGAKIIFSDTNTHYRGEKKYRTSGDVDAMRIAKDSYFAHQVMWDGWVDTEREHTYIVGHWNYGDGDKDGKPVMKPVYVVSTGDEVELFLNGKSLGKGQRSDTFLFTFNDVKWQQGELSAVSYKDGQEISRHSIHTVGKPAALRMRWVEAPKTFRADGHDIRIAEVEVVDQQGERCPLAHDMVTFSVKGQGEWLGGVSGLVEDSIDNRILNKVLPIEAGVCRVMVRSTTKAGQLTLTAEAKGFKKQQLTLTTTATPVTDGFYVDAQGKAIEADWGRELPLCTLRGETPLSPSFKATRRGLSVSHIEVPCNEALVPNLTDDNEYSNWQSDGRLENGWLVCHLEYKARVAEVVLRMQNFRSTSYPLEVTDGEGNVLWQGYTPKSLGYVYLPLKDNHTDVIKLRMLGKATVKEAFGDMTELAAKKAISTKPSKSNTLSILEIEFNENIQ